MISYKLSEQTNERFQYRYIAMCAENSFYLYFVVYTRYRAFYMIHMQLFTRISWKRGNERYWINKETLIKWGGGGLKYMM